MYIKQ